MTLWPLGHKLGQTDNKGLRDLWGHKIVAATSNEPVNFWGHSLSQTDNKGHRTNHKGHRDLWGQEVGHGDL